MHINFIYMNAKWVGCQSPEKALTSQTLRVSVIDNHVHLLICPFSISPSESFVVPLDVGRKYGHLQKTSLRFDCFIA
jgi:hypothetical protein